MKTQSILLLAAAAVAVYVITTRKASAAPAPGTRPATSSPTPGTSARANLERAAIAAGDRALGKVADAGADWLGGLFAERSPITSNMSTGGFSESYGLYNF